MEKDIIAQGDVLLVSDSIPENAKVLEKKTIAEGEVSGHRHDVSSGCDLLESDLGQMYVKVKGARERIQHLLGKETPTGEHDEIEFVADSYRVELQREWRRKEIVRNAD